MPDQLSAQWIHEQLAICEAASQGPWYDGFDDGSGRIGEYGGAYITLTETPEDRFPVVIVGGDYEGIPIGVLKQEDVDFIIVAHAGYAMVLSALRSLRKEVVQCPCCTEFYIKMREDDVLCPECVKEAVDASSE